MARGLIGHAYGMGEPLVDGGREDGLPYTLPEGGAGDGIPGVARLQPVQAGGTGDLDRWLASTRRDYGIAEDGAGSPSAWVARPPSLHGMGDDPQGLVLPTSVAAPAPDVQADEGGGGDEGGSGDAAAPRSRQTRRVPPLPNEPPPRLRLDERLPASPAPQPTRAAATPDDPAGLRLKLDPYDLRTSRLAAAVETRPGAAYRDEQIKEHSHYREPLGQDGGRAAGKSRRWGDASADSRNVAIEALLREAGRAGLDARQTALLLATAHVESGFNPDAAAGTTSASGLGQFIDKTGKSYGLGAANRWDPDAQAAALVRHFQDNQKLARQRGQGEEYIYKYHHDGPNKDDGGLDLSRGKVLPAANAYEPILKKGY